MGNAFSDTTESGLDLGLFDESENEVLQEFWSSRCLDDKDGLVKALEAQVSKDYGFLLCRDVHTTSESESDFRTFRDFVSALIRESTSKTLEVVYSAFIADESISARNKTACLFSLLQELSYGHVAKADRDLAAATSAKFCYRARRLNWNDKEIRAAVPTNQIVEFMREFAPFTSSVLQTHYQQLFGIPTSPSFRTFSAPSFGGSGSSSDIVKEHELMPLALYSEACQGRWQSLYSTNSSGFDFANISNAMVGYDGPTVLLIR